MGLQAILEKIRASGDEQIQEIERDTRSQANAILAQARMEAQRIEEDARADAGAPAIAERARILHQARLEALRIVGDERESLVDTAINCVRERLVSFRADPSYPAVLRSLAQEALAKLSSEGKGKVQLAADPRDRNLLEGILEDLGLTLPVRYDLDCWGGLIAKSEDGCVVVVNTFESRLERATAFLRGHLAALFEEEQKERDPKGFLETLRV